MPAYIDQLGHVIELPATPRSIVSLVPSITELLYTLQLDDRVTGITKFCIHPESWFRQKTRIGGTKNINTGAIRQLEPDLIIANKEENVKEQVSALAEEFPVFTTDINNLDDALEMIEQIGRITGTAHRASFLVSQITSAFMNLKKRFYNIKTGYLIWRNPYMTVGKDTFIHDMLTRCGLTNVFGDMIRYPAIDTWQLARCELLLLSSEPYPFQQKHVDELQAHLPDTRIMLVDGQMFSWYGSRLLNAPAYFSRLLQSIP
ncbi:helical backbone metal receptor [Longitalea arenae]|uniref:helical backbone metal receptor n=1 Tax=Longitalea arenae TaxID=2812558 RepID=UPI0019670439|nr:helical backbone metal receptor [Longitalea arenae]